MPIYFPEADFYRVIITFVIEISIHLVRITNTFYVIRKFNDAVITFTKRALVLNAIDQTIQNQNQKFYST